MYYVSAMFMFAIQLVIQINLSNLNTGAAELRKVSRMISETDGDITEDGLMEGVREGDSEGGKREEWMMDDKEQRVPEDSGTTLPPISEDEGSIFSVSQSSDFLQPTRCLGKTCSSLFPLSPSFPHFWPASSAYIPSHSLSSSLPSCLGN